MSKNVTMGSATPTAGIAVNKSRLKIYNKEGDLPTYYLQKGQEFQIELFNPTNHNVSARISLNGNLISQGGLILKPGQRVFLERYIDVAKKFLFDTYDVASTNEVKEAIKNNGDFKVEFYREKTLPQWINLGSVSTSTTYPIINTFTTNSGGHVFNTSSTNLSNVSGIRSSTSGNISLTNLNTTAGGTYSHAEGSSAFYSSTLGNLHDGAVTMDWMEPEYSRTIAAPAPDPLKSLTRGIAKRTKKSIETGRVEEGSNSQQKIKSINMEFEYFAFHTVEYKMLPVSQKMNTVDDLAVKVYCTKCGAKLSKGDNFCGKCGKKS